jgi:hypothetical protein
MAIEDVLIIVICLVPGKYITELSNERTNLASESVYIGDSEFVQEKRRVA